MKSVLISIQPKWCEKIVNGNKTIEVRKSAPKCDVPFRVFIYCTASDVHNALVVGGGEAKLIHCCNYKSAIPIGGVIGNGKVIGEFVCNEVEDFSVGSLRCDDIEKLACLSYKEMINYFYKPEELDGKTAKIGYGWHISDLVIYDKPRELKEFGLNRAPQSWCYVKEDK